MITHVNAENVHASKMQQPFGLVSTTFEDFPGPKPDSVTLQSPDLENLNFKFDDFPGSVCTLITVFPFSLMHGAKLNT